MQQFRIWMSLFNSFSIKVFPKLLSFTCFGTILFVLYIYIYFFFHFWVHGLVGSVVGMKKIIIVTCIFSTGLGFWEKELMLILFKAFWTQNLIKPTIHSTKVFLVYMNIVVDSVSTFHIILNCYFIWLQNYRFWILLLSMSSYPFY